MDPTTGLPLHVAVEAVGLTVAGVLVVWATIARRPVAIAGSVTLALVQAAYAGGFADDEVWASVMRIVAVAAIAAGGWIDPPMLVAGAAAVAGASVWRMAAEGNAAVLGLGPRIVVVIGFGVLAVWAARRTSVLVRTRIAAAFLGVLGVAIVVAGSTAARVGVANAVDRAQTVTSDAAVAEQRHLGERAQALLSRAALASAVLTELGPSEATVAQLRTSAFADADVVVSIDGAGRSTGQVDPGDLESLLRSPAVAAGRAGGSATGLVPVGSDALVVGAAPVFRTGGGRSPADVVGVLVAGDELNGTELVPRTRADGRPDVQLLSADGTMLRSSAAAPDIPLDVIGTARFRSGRLAVGGDDYVVSLAEVPLTAGPRTAVAASSPVAEAADVADAFPRGLVGGVLAAALLAVVIALWLSARITRPILSLADEAERVKTEFLSTVSHELRTPLTPIRGYADLLRRGRVPRRRAEAYLDEIDDAAQRLERIVTLLVEVAAIQAGRFTVEREAVPVDKILQAAATRWRRRSRRHDFKVRVTKSLPRVMADAEAIAAVLDELLDNAVKFSPEGGSVELRAQRGDGGVEIGVGDEGIGMEAEEVERLSSAFVQAEPGETRRFGGLGLGLTYAAGVLAAHDSRLHVEAVPAGGSTFSFVLPSAGMVSRMRDRTRVSK